MTRRPNLSKEEKIVIFRLVGAGIMIAEVMRTIGRRKQFIVNYICDTIGYKTRKPTGIP